MYIVIELQTTTKTAVLTSTYDDLAKAYQKYYTILAAAAVSSVPCHTAVILTETGAVVESKTFAHAQETEVEE